MSNASLVPHASPHMEPCLARGSYPTLILTPPPCPSLTIMPHLWSRLRVKRVASAHNPSFAAVSRPFAISVGWRGCRQLPRSPWAPPQAKQMPDVCLCAATFVYVRHALWPHTFIFFPAWALLTLFVVMFKIHCHVLMDNLPAPSSGGKARLLLVG